ncbi:uncharacterized protein [Anabrus simplex]|uniref:uncharacterized protein n=1 Tax=Anabrus simplex TaxID=316456 RepID=UPI0035A335AC
MKSGGGALVDQHNSGSGDDLFSSSSTSSRVYGNGGSTGGFVTKLRPTMISAKYRLKEERRKVLKISINKLRKIEDPESSLRRSVLINNTMKRLQREAREEKLQKQYPNRCFSSNTSRQNGTPSSVVNDSNSLLPSAATEANKENASPFTVSDFENDHKPSSQQVEDAVPQKPASQLVVCDETIDELVDVTGEVGEDSNGSVSSSTISSTVSSTTSSSSKKRTFDEVEDCDVHDVLSQFYMPPTPRMLTSIDDTDDEDEDVNVVDIDIVTPDMTLSSALQSSGVLTPEQPSKRPRLSAEDVDSSSSLDLDISLSSALSSATVDSNGQDVSSKRPRFDSEDNDDEVNVVDIEMSLPSSLQTDDCESSKSVDRFVEEQECDRLCRTIDSTTQQSSRSSEPSLSHPPSSHPLSCESEETDDIEVVLEDSEDVERRLFLCSNANRTRSSPSSVHIEEERPTIDSCWRSQQTSTDQCTTVDSHPLRFDISDSNKNVMSPCGNFCLGNNNNNNNAMVLDTTEHQYSCGHSSIFGEIQSVVYHSLIASLES